MGNFNVKFTKSSKMFYWASTVLAALALAAIGVADIMHDPKVLGGLVKLGYPVYFATILGLWKLLGSTAIMVPGVSRLKEWAYAGMFFTLTGAALSHAVSGDGIGHVLVPLLLLAAVMTSWALQPVRLKSSGGIDHARDVAGAPVRDGSVGATGAANVGAHETL